MVGAKKMSAVTPAAIALSALCLIGAGAAGAVALQEQAVQRISDAQRTPMEDGKALLASENINAFANQSDRARAGMAELAIMVSGQTQDAGERAMDLARAKEAYQLLAPHRPNAVETLVLQAQIDLISNKSPTKEGIAAFAKSYAVSPFVMHMGLWRVAYGAHIWGLLTPTTQQSVLDEAEWMTRFDHDKRAQIEGVLGDSPAGLAYQFRLINGRIGPDVSDDEVGRS